MYIYTEYADTIEPMAPRSAAVRSGATRHSRRCGTRNPPRRDPEPVNRDEPERASAACDSRVKAFPTAPPPRRARGCQTGSSNAGELSRSRLAAYRVRGTDHRHAPCGYAPMRADTRSRVCERERERPKERDPSPGRATSTIRNVHAPTRAFTRPRAERSNVSSGVRSIGLFPPPPPRTYPPPPLPAVHSPCGHPTRTHRAGCRL